MALKSRVCGVLRLLGMHPFDCERCSLADECEGRHMRERLQELSPDSTPTPATEASPPVDDDAA